VHLAGVEVQVDAVESGEGTEALADPAQAEEWCR
jgi:hypothetical protein